jgi:tryptophan synthase beta chain
MTVSSLLVTPAGRPAPGQADEISGAAAEIPRHWRSVLPHLGYELPADLTPASRQDSGAVAVNLPMEMARQSMLPRDQWEIPAPVRDAYQMYRPAPMWRATRFEAVVGAKVPIYVKYEGGNISGSHKLNTAIAQAYYYSRAGVPELVTGTGAGQWGTALAAACAMFGLRCTVFMVGSSLRRKPYRGVLMRLLGATVHASPSGLTEVSRAGSAAAGGGNGLALALGEAVEYAASRPGTAFSTGSGESYSIVHQSVIGQEALAALRAAGTEVDAVVGAFGAGSNFGGIALPFFAEARAAGTRPPLLVAAESSSSPKLTRGVYAYDQTDATGSGPMEAMYTIGSGYPIPDSHAAGLRYHGAAKLISAMRHHGQVQATAISQTDALEAGRLFAICEGTLPAPESGHALAAAARIAAGKEPALAARAGVLACVSGHGFLDLAAYGDLLDGALTDEAPAPEALREATRDLHLVPGGI